jgi:hypothetical protein
MHAPVSPRAEPVWLAGWQAPTPRPSAGCPAPLQVLHKYQQSLLESYMEDNAKVRFCPSVPWCGRAVEVREAPCRGAARLARGPGATRCWPAGCLARICLLHEQWRPELRAPSCSGATCAQQPVQALPASLPPPHHPHHSLHR